MTFPNPKELPLELPCCNVGPGLGILLKLQAFSSFSNFLSFFCIRCFLPGNFFRFTFRSFALPMLNIPWYVFSYESRAPAYIASKQTAQFYRFRIDFMSSNLQFSVTMHGHMAWGVTQASKAISGQTNDLPVYISEFDRCINFQSVYELI